MSNTEPSTIEQRQRDLEKKVIELLTKYTENRKDYRPLIMPECGDFYLSQIYEGNYESLSTQILPLFNEYFSRFILEKAGEGNQETKKKFAHRFYWGLTNPKTKLVKFLLNSCSDDIDFDNPDLPEGEFYPEDGTNDKNPYRESSSY